MTPDQAVAFAVLGATICLFVWDRLPYDLVALLALVAGVVAGIIPASKAFEGFADDIVVIVGSALVISHAVARSGVVETAMRPLLPYLKNERTQVPILAGAVASMSVFTKNIGALAIFMPVALQLARRTGTPASFLLMPMAFASLLGGTITLVGTSPNIIVSRVREEVTGKPFEMFDYTPVGLGITLAGLVFLAFGYRLLPRGRRGAASRDAAFTMEGYTAEARVPPDSPLIGRTVAQVQALGDAQVRLAAIIRERFRRFFPSPERRVLAGDVLLLEGEPEDLERLIARGGLQLAGEAPDAARRPMSVVEGVVAADSPLAGRTPVGAGLQPRHGVGLLAVSRSGQRITQRLDTLRLRAGDVVVLKGDGERLPETLGELHVLPLAERGLSLGASHRSFVPGFVLLGAMVAVALHLVPVAVAFFGAAVLLLLLRVMTMEEAYRAVDWPVLVLLGALIPVSNAVRDTGGTDLVAGWLSHVAQGLPPVAALALVLVAAMAVTPFLNNAATVLMLGPIAAGTAGKLGLNPDPFLMAVALGAASDFLTPIGHQCNTLVMGPGGYRFGDYWRLGLPLSLLIVGAGVPLIAFVWPLRG